MPDTHRHPAAGGAGEPSHLSIGEVLGLLLEEFPDVTISKIRFLESQGLIAPERTPSGYRKFFDEDVELLRVILREQRENYLPLRVIKDRISSGEIDPSGENTIPRGIRNVATGGLRDRDDDAGRDGSDTSDDEAHPGATDRQAADPSNAEVGTGSDDASRAGRTDDTQPAGLPRALTDPASPDRPASDTSTEGSDRSGASASPPSSHGEHRSRPEPREASERSVMDTAPVPTVERSGAVSGDQAGDPSRPGEPPADRQPATGHTATGESPRQQATHGPDDDSAPRDTVPSQEVERRPASSSGGGRVTSPQLLPGVTLTLDELCAMISATNAEVEALEEYGVVQGRDSAGERVYDEDAMAVARVAVQFLRLGVDARHLRGWKTAADREAGIYEQLITPLLRQRNPQGRQQANERLQQMDELGAELRAALMRVALRDLGRH